MFPGKRMDRAGPSSGGGEGGFSWLLTQPLEVSGSKECLGWLGPKSCMSEQGRPHSHPPQGGVLFQAPLLPVHVVTSPGGLDGPVVTEESVCPLGQPIRGLCWCCNEVHVAILHRWSQARQRPASPEGG